MSTLPTRKLGRNGPEVTAVGYGAMGLSAFYGPVPTSDSERFAVLNAALSSGITHFDTAHFYGDSEDLFSRWFESDASIRPRVFLATKIGVEVIPKGTQNNDTNPELNFGLRNRGDKEYVHSAIELAFSRLKVETIDLIYLHRIDRNTPIEVTIAAIKEWVDKGKVRHIGLSEASAATIRRAHAVHPISAVQVEYSPMSREIEENGVLAAARELGIAIVAYSPLGRGLLTGKMKSKNDLDSTDFRSRAPRFQEGNLEKNVEFVNKLEEVAKRREGVTAAQVCLAWVLSRGDDFFVIPGSKRVEVVKENAGAGKLALTEEELDVINQAVKEYKPAGQRYGGSMEDLYADSAPLKN